ncbi:MAG: Rieske 2Fe-2S domain-containing protein [Planctomycetales bacterium]|nr:Rieske 2Fe-2S domain-containing protein [Planctomycetales bacterium]
MTDLPAPSETLPPDEPLELCQLEQIPLDRGLEVIVAGRVVALFRVDGEVFALDGVCPHQGGALGKGQVCNGIVTCPWHGWQFDVKSGENQITRSICQPRIPLLVQENRVFVRRSDLAET